MRTKGLNLSCMMNEEFDYFAQLKGLESLRYWELCTVVRKFNEMEIPVMIIKGAIDLVAPTNRPPGSPPRLMGDIDLLIHKADWNRAVQVLSDLGYHSLFLNRNEDFFPPKIGRMEFFNSEPPGQIDLHYHFNKKQRFKGFINIEELWMRSKQVEFNDIKAFIPSPTDQLWIQLVHNFLFHTYSLEEMVGESRRLWYVVDLAYWNYKKIDWDEIIKKAQYYNLEILVYILLKGIKRKYKIDTNFCLNVNLYNKASLFLKWMLWAKRISPKLNNAIGRFNSLYLILNYRFCKICGIFYKEMVKGMSKDAMLEQYHISKLSFLFPIVTIVHFIRLIILHQLVLVNYLFFLWIVKRSRNLKNVVNN